MEQENAYTPRHIASVDNRTSRSLQSQRINDNPNPQRQSRSYQAQKRKKHTKRRRILRRTLVLSLIIVFVAAVIMIAKGLHRDELKGIWSLDQTTVYEFDGKGKGTLHLPLNDYAFTYTIDNNSVSIDFTDEHATDTAYTYSVDGAILILDNNTGSIFRLEKQK